MKKSFLSVGECMVELSYVGKDRLYKLGFAGDTFNTAYYVRQLMPPEWNVSYFTAVGDDPSSDNFLQFADHLGIDPTFVRRISSASIGLYLIHLDNGERSFSYWRETSAARQLADDTNLLAKGFSNAGCIYLSGITVAILSDVGRENLHGALSAARTRGTAIAFDPNLRPRLWQDQDEMRAIVQRFASLADIALPSFDDEKRFFGDNSPAHTLERYSGYGAETVVVKNSGSAILAHNAGSYFEIEVSPVSKPVDTTAAGDSFNGAFLGGFLAGVTFPKAINNASDVAAQVIQYPGALVEVKTFY